MPKVKLGRRKEDKLVKLLRGEFGTVAGLARALGCSPHTGIEILSLPQKRLTVERLLKLSEQMDVAELASVVFERRLVLSGERQEA